VLLARAVVTTYRKRKGVWAAKNVERERGEVRGIWAANKLERERGETQENWATE
jgi:hypothetical protein